MTRVAAIDIGTNSTRLLIADVDGEGRDAKLVPVERRTQITRLGQGVNESRALHPDAIARTLDTLYSYKQILDETGVERVRATATSASRDATNREDFFAPVEALLGVRPELLSGQQEAGYEYEGATAGLAEPSPYLLMDVGGGQAAILARGLEGGIGLGVVGDDVLDVVEQPGQPDLGGLAAARGGVGADDAGVPLVQGLADGIAAPAEELLGAALAEAQASDGVGDKAAALGAVEGVGGVLEEIAELGHPLHKSASWLGEADSVQSSQDQAITRIRLRACARTRFCQAFSVPNRSSRTGS